MRTIGAVLGRAEPGEVAIEMTPRDELTQQHGYVHAGIVTAIAEKRLRVRGPQSVAAWGGGSRA
jgi:acyl-coenzyme A thioesterase PaaI-like protein